MQNYIVYFYDKYSILDSFKFSTYDDFSAIKKTERMFDIIAYKRCALFKGDKKIEDFVKKD